MCLKDRQAEHWVCECCVESRISFFSLGCSENLMHSLSRNVRLWDLKVRKTGRKKFQVIIYPDLGLTQKMSSTSLLRLIWFKIFKTIFFSNWILKLLYFDVTVSYILTTTIEFYSRFNVWMHGRSFLILSLAR